MNEDYNHILVEHTVSYDDCYSEDGELVEKFRSWQPIETAPMNGRYIMILCAGAGTPAIARFEYESRIWTALGDVDSFDNPVYWLPLPEPPNAVLSGKPSTEL